MKISGRTIMQRLYGATRWGNRLSRARYFRGHGVHSPFVYSIVRKVFMRSGLIGDAAVFERLVSEGELPRKRAVELSNLAEHCAYSQVGLDYQREACALVVLSAKFPTEELEAVVEAARASGTTLAIMSPYANRERDRACRRIVESHRSTTIDNRGYLLVFNNHLPKQHFKL